MGKKGSVMKKIATFLACVSALFSDVIPGDCMQLIVVRTQDWQSPKAKMQSYKRSMDGKKWLPASPVHAAVVGKNGLGWGLGLVDCSGEAGPRKKEGDNKGPAGLFDLGVIFAKYPIDGISLPFVQITDDLEAVDDPKSKYYNRIVSKSRVDQVDWDSSEKMMQEDLYDIGIEVLHNSPCKDPQAGSAIFVHRWRAPGKGTAGCLAMELVDVERICLWLDDSARPVLVQLPESEFQRLQIEWQLPSFIGE